MVLDQLRHGLLLALDMVNQVGMRDAKIDRLADVAGITLAIPEKPGDEVTPEIRAYIIVARARYGEFEWLYPSGPRDQICMRFNLSRPQIAGVLAAETKRESAFVESEPASEPASEKPEPAPARTVRRIATRIAITDDPKTWPRRNGDEGQPTRMKYQIDATDWKIARAVLDAVRWDELRNKIGYIRSLSPQQVASLKAVLSRGDIPLAFHEKCE